MEEVLHRAFLLAYKRIEASEPPEPLKNSYDLTLQWYEDLRRKNPATPSIEELKAMFPSGGPGELDMPAPAPPEETPEPDSVPEIVEKVLDVDEEEVISDELAEEMGENPHLWADPADFPELMQDM